MSAGAFAETTFYVSNKGNKMPVKVQPETLEATIGGALNASGAGPATPGFPSAIASGSKRRLGIHCRAISVKLTGSPTGYKPGSYYRIPVMSQSVWDGVDKFSPVTYLGVPGTVINKFAEETH